MNNEKKHGCLTQPCFLTIKLKLFILAAAITIAVAIAIVAAAVALVKVEFEVGAAIRAFDFAFAKHIFVEADCFVASGTFYFVEILVTAAAIAVVLILVFVKIFFNCAEVLVNFLDVVASFSEFVLDVGDGKSHIVESVDDSKNELAHIVVSVYFESFCEAL